MSHQVNLLVHMVSCSPEYNRAGQSAMKHKVEQNTHTHARAHTHQQKHAWHQSYLADTSHVVDI